jgi:hypothetical protein
MARTRSQMTLDMLVQLSAKPRTARQVANAMFGGHVGRSHYDEVEQELRELVAAGKATRTRKGAHVYYSAS